MTREQKLDKIDDLLRRFEAAALRAHDSSIPDKYRLADRADRADIRSQILVTAAEPVQ